MPFLLGGGTVAPREDDCADLLCHLAAEKYNAPGDGERRRRGARPGVFHKIESAHRSRRCVVL